MTSRKDRDRPYLLPSNHRLRNLVSISLRTLSLTSSSTTSAGSRGTTDDDALPHTLVSPAKLVALREQKTVNHARSSSDLRSVAEENALAASDNEAQNGSPTKIKKKLSGGSRPSMKKMRRRSTLEWANASPQRRQEKLERVTGERMADVFFTVHVAGVEEPVYISETLERTMNPTFRHIDWNACGPGIMRADRCTLKFWIKRGTERWKGLLECEVKLNGLHWLGKSLDSLPTTSLPHNAVLFHLADGVYTISPTHISSPDFLSDRSTTRPNVNSSNSARLLQTSSFDALLRLAKLDDSIQDALATRNQLAASLEALLQKHASALTDRDRLAEAEDRFKTIDYAKKTVQKQLEKARRQQDEKRTALKNRRELMAKDLEHRQHQAENMKTSRPALDTTRSDLKMRQSAIRAQRRRIVSDLQSIYPLDPLPTPKTANANPTTP